PPVFARGRHVILDTLPSGRDDPELAGGVVGGQQAVLRGVLAAQGDDDVLVVAGGAHAHPVALVVLLVDEDVLVGGGADLVPPHLEGAPRLVHADVEQVCRVRGPGGPVADAGDRVVDD